MTESVLIVGGGASGLAAAITAANNGNRVVLLEKNERVGKKLLVTGNGRCNFGNLSVSDDSYNNNKFVSDVLLRAKEGANKLFEKIGLLSYADPEGRLYPVSETATSVLDCLRFECERAGVEFVTGKTADAVYKRDVGYTVVCGNENLFARKIIIAVGGKAQAPTYNLEKLVENRVIVPYAPSLTPIKVEPLPRALSGLRAKCVASLYKNAKPIRKEKGEVQFKDNSLSGIVILNMSSFIARSKEENGFEISLDLFPHIRFEELLPLLKERYSRFGSQHLMTGMFHNRLADEIKRRAILLDKNDISGLAAVIKDFRFTVTGLAGFSEAQVMCGGIDTKALKTSLEFRKNEGLYACGEVVDIDGLCGGFNLHWAFSSGIVAGELE